MGRKIAVTLLAVAVASLGQFATVAAKTGAAPDTNASRAQSAYRAMQTYFYVGSPPLYRGTYPADPNANPYSYHWPFSQAMAGTIDMYGFSRGYRDDVVARLAGLETYWDAQPALGPGGYDSYVVPPLGNGGDKFYDDNAWTGLDLVRVYRLSGDRRALQRAQDVFEFVQSGWATASVCVGPASTGGVFWKQQTPTERIHDRNTVSNAPNAELGLQLFQLTGQTQYLEAATQMYAWVNAHLRDTDGLYFDHVGVGADGGCTVETTKWSYNQGTMIGANVLLYQITHDTEYLDRANDIASAALNYYGCNGGMCGAGSAILGQSPAFNAIFFRDLLFLASANPNGGPWRAAAQSYGELVWNNATIRKSDAGGALFYFKGDYVDLLDQAAMVEVYADLSWSPADFGSIL